MDGRARARRAAPVENLLVSHSGQFSDLIRSDVNRAVLHFGLIDP
jgi:hypothetical protein